MYKILIVDDEESIRLSAKAYLSSPDYEILLAEDGETGVASAISEHPDVVLTDLKMPKLNGIELLKKIKEYDPSIIVIIMTGFNDINATITAMQHGAFDYLSKPLDKEWLKLVIKKAFDSKRLQEKVYIANSTDSALYTSRSNLIGNTQVMKEIAKSIGVVSNNRVSVLIQGESGSGKEVVAKTIHYCGITKDEPFIALNCSALNESLLESELFGHEKGAFTGAIREKKGKFELAGEGTIFLDEISETSLSFQAKLLRILQEREFERVGGEKTIPVMARIIASTNKNLEELVNQGKFREDLFFRLKVFCITVPALRERKEDIPQLVMYFLEKCNKELHKSVNKIPFEVMELLQNHDYVGNVRELENILLNAVLKTNGSMLHIDSFNLEKPLRESREEIKDPDLSLAQIEKLHIIRVLKHTGGDKNKAAAILDISRSTLYKKIEEYNIIL
jgi:two-component system response regulator AtoC